MSSFWYAFMLYCMGTVDMNFGTGSAGNLSIMRPKTNSIVIAIVLIIIAVMTVKSTMQSQIAIFTLKVNTLQANL